MGRSGLGLSVCLSVLMVLAGSVVTEAMPSDPAYLRMGAVQAPPRGAEDLCVAHVWACRVDGMSSPVSAKSQMTIVTMINREINATVPEISDLAQYGELERWALPTARGGDCEDIAMRKKSDLIEAGIAPQGLMLSTVLDRDLNAHAVLVFRSESGDLVLDNLTDRILPWAETGYSFLRMQDPASPDRWRAVLSGGIFGGE